jgi:ribosomal protein L31E
MRQKSGTAAISSERIVKDIRRATRKHYSVEEKIRIAADLNISRRTVENHRASIMKRTGSKSLPALARLALAATGNSADEPRFQAPRR